jgi:two-component system chemotaxis response regulator CheY
MSQTFHFNTKILIVEDTPIIRDTLKAQLRELGYKQIVEARDGAAAYQEICDARQAQDPFGLIISDLHMPNVTGLEFLKLVRAVRGYEQTPFILVTAETDRRLVIAAMAAGVSNYIMKPLEDILLKEKLETTWLKYIQQSTQKSIPLRSS